MVVQFNIFGGCQLIMTPYIVNQYDEKHIFRYKTLDRLFSAIYEKLRIKYIDDKKVFVNRLLVAYPDERQAEVLNSWRLLIKERVKIHIKVLRCLRKHGRIHTQLHISSCYVQISIAILYNMNKPEMSNAGLKLYVCDRPELWHLAAR